MHAQTGENVFVTRVPTIGEGVNFSRSMIANPLAAATSSALIVATARRRCARPLPHRDRLDSPPISVGRLKGALPLTGRVPSTQTLDA
jgi:hypothetical protein